MENTCIYILIDPRNEKVRYIGKADKPLMRFNRHIRDTAVTHKTNWIKQLKQANLLPKIEIIDSVPKKDWQSWEKYYISYYKKLGCKLVNIALGGLGGGNTFWKGKKRDVKTNEKIRIALTGRKLSESARLKIIASKGYLKRTKECFNKIGEKNSKLTKAQVLQIRQIFFTIKWGAKARLELSLSQQYGVSTRTIRSIVKKEVWKHI